MTRRPGKRARKAAVSAAADVLPKLADVHVRWMIRKDLAVVRDIERVNLDGPSLIDMKDLIRERNVVAMVAEVGDIVVGWMAYRIFKKRYELARMSTSLWQRRRGVGAAMMCKLVGRMTTTGRGQLTCLVADWNVGAHLFLKEHGFEAVGVSRTEVWDYYEFARGPKDDRDVWFDDRCLETGAGYKEIVT